MKHRPNLQPLTERANVNKESYADFVKPVRAISPAFRPGPRQRCYDPNADEVIRFVRELQRQDLPYQSPAALIKRSVLPAIGIHGSGDDVKGSPATHVHGYKTISSIKNLDIEDIPGDHIISAKELIESAQDIPSSSVGNLAYGRFENDLPSFRLQLSKENTAPFDEELQSTMGIFPVADDDIQSFRLDRFQDNANSDPVYTFSNGVSKMAQLRRPRAIPQLPPIPRSKLHERPSAPSPSHTPPAQTPSAYDEENHFLD